MSTLGPSISGTAGSGEFLLRNGRTIKLSALQQWVKVGPLDGAPNASQCQDLVRADADRYGNRAGFYLVQPPLIALRPDWDGPRNLAPMWLPRIVVIGDFESDYPVGPVNESGWDKSQLRILWYQEQWALPIDATVLDEIVSMDWESLAVDVVMPY